MWASQDKIRIKEFVNGLCFVTHKTISNNLPYGGVLRTMFEREYRTTVTVIFCRDLSNLRSPLY
jgi:hypothetical protein